MPGSDDLRMVTFVADDQYIFEVGYRSADAGGADAIAMVADPDGNWWDYRFLLNGRTKESVEAAAVLLGGSDAPLDQWYVWDGDL